MFHFFIPFDFPLDFHFRSCVISRNIICHFNMSVSQRSLHIIILYFFSFVHIHSARFLSLLQAIAIVWYRADIIYNAYTRLRSFFPVCASTTQLWLWCLYINLNKSSFNKCASYISFIVGLVKRQYIIIWRVWNSKPLLTQWGEEAKA